MLKIKEKTHRYQAMWATSLQYSQKISTEKPMAKSLKNAPRVTMSGESNTQKKSSTTLQQNPLTKTPMISKPFN